MHTIAVRIAGQRGASGGRIVCTTVVACKASLVVSGRLFRCNMAVATVSKGWNDNQVRFAPFAF